MATKDFVSYLHSIERYKLVWPTDSEGPELGKFIIGNRLASGHGWSDCWAEIFLAAKQILDE